MNDHTATVDDLRTALLPGHADREGTNAATPAAVQAQLLRGTIVVGTYRGTGKRDIPVPQREIPRYFIYAAYASCTGGGSLEGPGGSPW